MWPGSFGIDETDSSWELLDTLWSSRMMLYRKELAAISDRLDVRVAKRLSTEDFHGFRLDKMELVQGEQRAKARVLIRLVVTDGREGYEVAFKGVLRFEVGEVDSSVNNGEGDIWGYSEVLPVDDKTLSFEVIFSSGMSLYIVFPNKGLKIKKLQVRGAMGQG
jgi:hypothetical protein